MDDDWDLNAVVRGYCRPSSSSSSTTNNHSPAALQDPFLLKPQSPSASSIIVVQDLHQICKPYFSQETHPPPPISQSQINFSPQNFPIPKSPLPDIQLHLRQKQPPFSVSNGSKSNPTSRPSKRRKNHLKKVCHVAAENLSSDMWSWRKYGQKPIKGSPYPRGYYRCSTSKGCMARKQVERNRSDPSMFIVTYTSDHNHPMPTHRNSLAGSTRQKPDEQQPKPSLESTSREEEEEEELPEIEDEEGDDEMRVINTPMAMDDDFFAGLEDYERVSGHLHATVQFPWLSNSVTTTTAGGG